MNSDEQKTELKRRVNTIYNTATEGVADPNRAPVIACQCIAMLMELALWMFNEMEEENGA